MTTTRCRRHHQGDCAGNVHGDLCNRHRAAWDAMRKDWDERAAHPPTVPPIPPFVVWLSTESKMTNALRVTTGWYFNCEACEVTQGFRHEDDAHTHMVAHVCRPTAPTAPPAGRYTPKPGDGWTEAEDRILATHGNKEAMRLTGRTLWAVAARRKTKRLLIPTAIKPWTKAEDKVLRTRTAEDAHMLLEGRSLAQINARRKEFGITRIDAWTPAEDKIVTAMTPAKAQKLLPNRGIKGIRNRRRILRERRSAA